MIKIKSPYCVFDNRIMRFRWPIPPVLSAKIIPAGLLTLMGRIDFMILFRSRGLCRSVRITSLFQRLEVVSSFTPIRSDRYTLKASSIFDELALQSKQAGTVINFGLGFGKIPLGGT